MASLKYEYFVKHSMKSSASEFLRTTRCHPEINKYLFEDKKITRQEQEDWYKKYSDDEDVRIYLVINKDEVYVGYVIFTIDSLYHRRAEVGYVIHPDFQRNGHGKKIVDWSIQKAQSFEEGIHRLFLTVFPWNVDAVKLYERAGFEKESMAKDYVFKDDKYMDVLFMAILFELC